ncbi:MAG TPA: DUF3224 domain-containing protein [Micromonosporaceae bacterium]
MTTRATGNFDLNWDEQPPYDKAEGATLAKVTVTKKFRGDLVGTSVAELIKAMTDVPDSAGYVAIERVTGTLHGREGSFVLQHNAIMDRGKGDLQIRIVPDSGTGELKGISGTMHVDPSKGHFWTLDYSIDESA